MVKKNNQNNNKSRSSGTKKEFVYASLKEAIIKCEFDPGMMLTERELCEKYNVSRTPVREVLRQLTNENMVELVVGRGAFIKKLSLDNMIEIYEVREALEKMAVKLFILKNNGRLNDKLKQRFDEQISYEQSDPQKFMAQDMEFHLFIADGAKNKQLLNMLLVVYDQIKLLAFSSENDEKVRVMAHAHHQAILDAILEGDVSRAEQSIVEHIEQIKRYHLSKYIFSTSTSGKKDK